MYQYLTKIVNLFAYQLSMAICASECICLSTIKNNQSIPRATYAKIAVYWSKARLCSRSTFAQQPRMGREATNYHRESKLANDQLLSKLLPRWKVSLKFHALPTSLFIPCMNINEIFMTETFETIWAAVWQGQNWKRSSRSRRPLASPIPISPPLSLRGI